MALVRNWANLPFDGGEILLRFVAIYIATAALFMLAAGAQPQTLLERGSYLVNGIMTCHHCHTPKDKAGNPIMERQFSGN